MKNKLIFTLLAIFCVIISLSAISASDLSNNTNDLAEIDSSDDYLSSVETVTDENEPLAKSDDSSPISVSENSSEALSLNVEESNEILSSSASVSSDDNPHTYHINGYTFTVSGNQYGKIKDAINMGKKHDWLDNGFAFKVKTDKVIKVKKLVSKKTYKKKVRYEGLTRYPYNGIKLANLKKYYNKGWKKTFTSYETAKHSKKYLGYNYVILKKTVKKYKKVKMRVYAEIEYQGWSRYYDGPHYYYPWVSFEAQKAGYSSKYLDFADITK